jgi:hypothetical protein
MYNKLWNKKKSSSTSNFPGISPTDNWTLHYTTTLRVSEWVILRPTVSRPVYLGIKPPSGAYDQIFITVRQLLVCWYGMPSLTRGQVCLLQLLLFSPAQSFSGPSPAGLMTSFYCLRFETRPTWRTSLHSELFGLRYIASAWTAHRKHRFTVPYSLQPDVFTKSLPSNGFLTKNLSSRERVYGAFA